MSSDTPRISVVIATRDRPEDLARCLGSVLLCEHDAFEVIVVDQSDPPSPVPLDHRLVHLPTDGRGKSAALNVGIAAARASLLAFTDDDCTVPPDWLTGVEALFELNPEIAMAFGELRPIDHDPTRVYVPAVEIQEFRIMRDARAAHTRGGAGANLAARRTVFDAIGRWDEQIGPGSRFRACEEYDVYYRALASGRAVAFAPQITATHWGARSYADGAGGVLKRNYAYGEGAVIGKHLRIGDRRMAIVAARIAAEDLRLVASCLAHRQRIGLGQVACKWGGVAKGVITPVDRRRRVFAGSAAVRR